MATCVKPCRFYEDNDHARSPVDCPGLVVTGNSILDCPTSGIVVQAIGGNGRIAPAGGHKNVSIVGNTFSNVALPFILCTSTEDLTLKDNRFPAEKEVPSAWGAGLVPTEKKGAPVVTVNCTEAESPARETAPRLANWQKHRLPSRLTRQSPLPLRPVAREPWCVPGHRAE